MPFCVGLPDFCLLNKFTVLQWPVPVASRLQRRHMFASVKLLLKMQHDLEHDGLLRVWWSLLVHGHKQARVLEGGWEAWVSAGCATEIDEPCPLKVRMDDCSQCRAVA